MLINMSKVHPGFASLQCCIVKYKLFHITILEKELFCRRKVTSTWVSNRQAPTKLHFALKCANRVGFWSVFQGITAEVVCFCYIFGSAFDKSSCEMLEIHVFFLLVSVFHSEPMALHVCFWWANSMTKQRSVVLFGSHLQHSQVLQPGVYVRDYRIAHWQLWQK